MQKLNAVFFYQLEKAIKSYRQYAQQTLKKQGHTITIDQWLVLKTITDHPDITQNELAVLVFKDKASVTRIIDLLVKGRYLSRKTHRDSKRRNQLSLTAKGEAMIEDVIPTVLRYRKAALKGLSEAEIRAAERVLQVISANCITD